MTAEVKLQVLGGLLLFVAGVYIFLWRRQIHKKRELYQGSFSESEYGLTTLKPALEELGDLSRKSLPHLEIVKTVLTMLLTLLGLLLSGAILLVVGWDDPAKLFDFSGALLGGLFLICLYLLYDGTGEILAYLRQHRVGKV